ncbi:UbiH/UbiF family hydroxylase [Szabonella alba]|uniref:UbiH/UbiF family hydroxylase n=1 Tax=Szabonella alba TaxID=2804194 RepID=A0A8K0Y2H9_9RHOB|nr:UbiH/UbiF family hydroxylase [Szabonella alba]MBL4917629.1 UbiH/UbiF family hydroxylase [Szabonella alba]
MVEKTDILISGGGVAGLMAAAGFGASGFRVICVDPAPPVTDATTEGADLRSTAFLQPAVALLDDLGIWPRLAPHATPLQTMRIVDAGGAGNATAETTEPRLIRDFDAAEISEAPFGQNLPNWLLRRELVAHLAGLETVDFRPGIATTALATRETEARVTLSDGARISARLLIAADGRTSPMRVALGIGVRTRRYGQKALAFAVTHPEPHRNISTEVHRSGGPFTLVPLPDHAGHPASAVVWMETGPEIARLMALSRPEFEVEMTRRSSGVLGPLKLATRLTAWPIITQAAERMTGQRAALMAEAAHVLPPIGAQGLNMSLADLACLLTLARERPDTLGDARMLDDYHRRRHPEITARITGIDLLNRASMAGAQPLRDLRMEGLRALHGLAPLRHLLMKAGLGAT